jgi:hypothetical protein
VEEATSRTNTSIFKSGEDEEGDKADQSRGKLNTCSRTTTPPTRAEVVLELFRNLEEAILYCTNH